MVVALYHKPDLHSVFSYKETLCRCCISKVSLGVAEWEKQLMDAFHPNACSFWTNLRCSDVNGISMTNGGSCQNWRLVCPLVNAAQSSSWRDPDRSHWVSVSLVLVKSGPVALSCSRDALMCSRLEMITSLNPTTDDSQITAAEAPCCSASRWYHVLTKVSPYLQTNLQLQCS